MIYNVTKIDGVLLHGSDTHLPGDLNKTIRSPNRNKMYAYQAIMHLPGYYALFVGNVVFQLFRAVNCQ